MKIGLIARADRSGLGIQTHEFYRAMRPDKTLVINVGHLHNDTTHCNKRTDLGLYPGAMVFNDWSPNAHMITQFMRGLDVVFSAETFYSNELVPLARRMGVRTVLQPNWEFMPLHQEMPDMLAVPSLWHWGDFPHPKIHLPVPIATDRFDKPRDHRGIRRFLHVVGRPAVMDRNGTPDVLAAMQHVKSEIKLIIKCQDRDYAQHLVKTSKHPPNVDLVADCGDVENYWDNYRDGDVLIMPRRFGGLTLPVNEALGAGLPVIMTDIEPNNTWLPREWLVPASKTAEFMAFNRVDVYTADHRALARKVDEFAADSPFYAKAKLKAAQLRDQLSWAALKPRYEKALSGS